MQVAADMKLFLPIDLVPPWPLFPAIISTQLIATLIVVYGIILPSIGWKLALFVWGYALSWFLFNDLVKLGAGQYIKKPLTLERIGLAIKEELEE